MIKIQSLRYSHSKKTKLYEDLSFEMTPGSITGVLGKNGAGKTTLLKIIVGMLYPKSGKVQVGEYIPADRKPSFLEGVYYLPEEFYLPGISVANYIKANAGFYPKFDHQQMNSHLEEFEIPTNVKLSNMSYGQKKKFLIAFALATKCDLLVLDEPTNGLDIPSKALFRKLIAGSIEENQLVLISTHQVKDVENLIDRIMIIDDGNVVMEKEMLDISERLRFASVKDLDGINPLYSEVSPGGYRVILPEGDLGSSVDIELLFNAITKGIKLDGK